jgi:hypothetical protein
MWHIARRELLHNLLSLRFALGTALVVLLMGVIGYVLLIDFEVRQQAHLSAVEQHRESLADSKVYSRLSVTVDFPPSPLSMFAQGIDELPTHLTVSAYSVPTLVNPQNKGTLTTRSGGDRPYNPLLRLFSRIDLAFVVRLILSLLALLLVFDNYSGERERGTLPMVLACPVRRLEVLAGKLFGGLLTVAVPLVAGFLVVLLLWSLSGATRLDDTGLWLGVLLLFCISLVYLLAFVALGTWMSLRVSDSSSGLMAALLVWLVVTVVIPQGVGYLAHAYRPHEIRRQVMDGDGAERRRFSDRYWELQKLHPADNTWGHSGGGLTGGRTLLGTTRESVAALVEFTTLAVPIQLEYADVRYRSYERYERALQHWADRRQVVLSTSLASIYENLAIATAGTGLSAYADALTQSRRYRSQLVEWLRPKSSEATWFTRLLEHPEMEITDENRARWRQLQEREGDSALWEKVLTWDNTDALDLRDMPVHDIALPPLTRRLQTVAVDLALLLLFAGAAVLMAARRALRAPVM